MAWFFPFVKRRHFKLAPPRTASRQRYPESRLTKVIHSLQPASRDRKTHGLFKEVPGNGRSPMVCKSTLEQTGAMTDGVEIAMPDRLTLLWTADRFDTTMQPARGEQGEFAFHPLSKKRVG